MAEVTLKPEAQEPQAETPTQASKNFMGKASDRIGKFIANEPFIPYSSALFAVGSGMGALVRLALGDFSYALTEGSIAGISAMIASETLKKSSFGQLIQKGVKEIKEAAKKDLSNRP